MTSPSDCPCGRGASYAACCARFHQGAEPAEPRDLMAARYAAFVHGDAPFLFKTLHPQHDEHAHGPEALARSLRAQKQVRYLGLTILDAQPADSTGAATVLFHAQVRARGRDVSFVELSYFLHDGTGWRYLAGETRAARDMPRWREATIDGFAQG